MSQDAHGPIRSRVLGFSCIEALCCGLRVLQAAASPMVAQAAFSSFPRPPACVTLRLWSTHGWLMPNLQFTVSADRPHPITAPGGSYD